ncbi:hypothetical protein ANN_21435 [Periplaneta americana]|uniref:Uncharacterized protein n=1 Tax=Periplaneta americana TaxID=6978 RepID=A0ABQ8SG64_PERAM|nr:hypothetical protein ANN_21435 [Periplaneta americana]
MLFIAAGTETRRATCKKSKRTKLFVDEVSDRTEQYVDEADSGRNVRRDKIIKWIKLFVDEMSSGPYVIGRNILDVLSVDRFTQSGVLLHASKSNGMTLLHLNTLKCHRPGPRSNPQPPAQKTNAIPTTLPRQTPRPTVHTSFQIPHHEQITTALESQPEVLQVPKTATFMPNTLEVCPVTRIQIPSTHSEVKVEGKPRKNLNQVTCPDQESNQDHLVSGSDALTVTPQVCRITENALYIAHRPEDASGLAKSKNAALRFLYYLLIEYTK